MATCAECHKPLTLQIELDSDGPAEGSSSQGGYAQDVPDDVELSCGCHFHWQCLLDVYEVTQCPHCQRDISVTGPSGEPQILCMLRNEGGAQEGLDIFPVLSEELYLKAYPDDRKPRAFLEFCREGDLEAIVDLLKANEASDEDNEYEEEEEDDEVMDGADSADGPTIATDAATILRYQDPIGDNRSALHVAVANNKVEVIWLLLLLASTLDEAMFPPKVKQTALQLGISREDQAGQPDIRTLKDSDGKIAAYYFTSGLGIDAGLIAP